MKAGRNSSPNGHVSRWTVNMQKHTHRASPDLRRSSNSPLVPRLTNVKTATVSLRPVESSPKTPDRSTTTSDHKHRASPSLRSKGWRASDYQNVDKLLKEAEDISSQMALRATRPQPEVLLASDQRKTLVARVIQRIRQTAGSACDTLTSRLSESAYLTASLDTPSLKTSVEWEDEGEGGVRKPPLPVPEENSPARELPDDEIFSAVSPYPYPDENRPPVPPFKSSLHRDSSEPDYKTLYEALQIRFRDEQVRTI